MNQEVYNIYVDLLKEYIEFRSISTLADPLPIRKTLAWLTSTFRQRGFKINVIEGYDNPIILAELEINKEYPTVLIYGHYDVQPASMAEWGEDPFSLTEKNNRLYGRGVVDNKGQMLVHLATVIQLIQKDALKYNIKFLVEGNEETGSPSIERFIFEYEKELKSDFVLISDGALAGNKPTIEMGLRGVVNTTLVVKTSDREMHSGMYGGPVPNAIHEAAKLIASIHDNENKVTIPGFYTKVKTDVKIQDYLLKRNISIDEYEALTGSSAMLLEEGNNYFSQIGARPTIQITGFSGGYTEKGYRNSIPSEATIKFNIRLVPDQDPEEVLELFKGYVTDFLPRYVDCRFLRPDDNEGFMPGITLSGNDNYTNTAKKILQEVFKEEVVYDYNGGSLPIVVSFVKVLTTPVVMIPLANEDCNMHGVNENFDLQILEKAITFSYKFLSTSI